MKNFGSLSLMLTLFLTAFAGMAQAITIDGIYYSVNSENSVTVMVDYDYDPQTQVTTYHYYTGQLNIPSTITFEGKTYTVNKIFIYGCKDLTVARLKPKEKVCLSSSRQMVKLRR